MVLRDDRLSGIPDWHPSLGQATLITVAGLATFLFGCSGPLVQVLGPVAILIGLLALMVVLYGVVWITARLAQAIVRIVKRKP